ncbi:hypothetical protein M2160_009299 [Streptomyces sp. SAI-117]|uniref:hypothetical protein n=1 Tax=Streptomyces sp. SAI-117 TaxID=2940546 RepID=UPI002474AF8B|nr:hypothetical protein [Streptomyces sp. SAI-117]MDH6574192.1 hypothetical protein [Streptomyces sp. SAI-117]
MSEFDAARPELRANVVNVTVPVKVFHDLDAIQEVQRKVLDQLGCRACCSGWDIRFDVARQFLVDERLNVRTINQIQQLEQ